MTDGNRTRNYWWFWVNELKIRKDKGVTITNDLKDLQDQITLIHNKDKHPKRIAMLWKESSLYTDEERQLAALNPDIEQDKKQLGSLMQQIWNYQKAISANRDAIKKTQESTSEQITGSWIKQQTKQAYAAGQASKRGDTSAELAKTQADIDAGGAAERANIKAAGSQNLSTAYANLANTQFSIGEAQRSFDVSQKNLDQYKGSVFKKWTTEVKEILDKANPEEVPEVDELLSLIQ